MKIKNLHAPHLYFDTRDGEWSVYAYGQDYSDLVACDSNDPIIAQLGEDAYLLNTTPKE